MSTTATRTTSGPARRRSRRGPGSVRPGSPRPAASPTAARTTTTTRATPPTAAPANTPPARTTPARTALAAPAEAPPDRTTRARTALAAPAEAPPARTTPARTTRARTAATTRMTPTGAAPGRTAPGRPAAGPDRAPAGPPARTPLPPHVLFAERLLAVLSGERPVHWMLGQTVGEAYDQLIRLAPTTPLRARGARPVIRRCGGFPLRPGVVEAFASIAAGEQVRAMAFRLEQGTDRKWRCAAVELGGERS
ncbi:Rv3235 family protein [Streptomyces lavendofoliae]|uniref:Rv3235 family protein n=1 Tax=Streptomyces lavendofoliae TaxID=67314 RepID=UPI003D8E4C36